VAFVAVIASEAKQSILPLRGIVGLLRFAHNDVDRHVSAFPRRDASELCDIHRPRKIRGRREGRVPAGTRGLVCKSADRGAHEHTGISQTSGLPCAMVLRLIPRSPRRRIRLASVANGLAIHRSPVGLDNLHQLDTSNGCQDHTALPYASAPFVCALQSLTGEPPCDPHHAPTLPRPPQPAPTFVTTADAPLAEQDGGSCRADLGWPKTGFFFRAGLDGTNRVERIEEISPRAHAGFLSVARVMLARRYAPLP
jgi:hypothetical protein